MAALIPFLKQVPATEREIESVIELALSLRETLDIAHRTPVAADAWLLADYLREGVVVVEDAITTGRIWSCGWRGKLDVITVAALGWAPENRRAFILAHELGHYLCTQPLRIHLATEAAWNRRSSYRSEMLAEAFACAFLDVNPLTVRHCDCIQFGYYGREIVTLSDTTAEYAVA